ncbi:MAG: cytochrome-c peroxidase, partial [Ramlibacter sp.]
MNKRVIAVAVAAAALAASVWAAQDTSGAQLRDKWSAQDVATLASMRLKEAGPRPADASNAYEQRTDAAAFGRALFNDTRLSRNGQVACVSCHSATGQFEDGRQFGKGIATGKRRTMPVMGTAHSPFLFWDGRKDSVWSQALGPMEDAAEHGGNRVRLVRVVLSQYRDQYRGIFGAPPQVDK